MSQVYFDGFEGLEPTDFKITESDGLKQIMVKGHPLFFWTKDDLGFERIAIIQLHRLGKLSPEILSSLFGLHVNSIKYYIREHERAGLSGLLIKKRGPKEEWKLVPQLRAKILFIFLRERLMTYEAIQERLKEIWAEEVSLPSIRGILIENGLIEDNKERGTEIIEQIDIFSKGQEEDQLKLELKSNELKMNCHKETDTVESNPEDEKIDEKFSSNQNLEGIRALRHYSASQRKYLEVLETDNFNTYAGGLLYLPLIQRYSFLSVIKKNVNINTYEGYSVSEIFLTLLYLNIFNYRSIEDFKKVYAEEFGVFIGRLCCPSHYTLRRFLNRAKELNVGEKLIEDFAVEYLREGIAKWGILYIDGHFLPYHGKELISMGWHGVLQTPMKGSYNFIGVDERFTPWIFLIRSSSEDLLEKIPEIIEKVKQIGSKAGFGEEQTDKIVVLFDREGYSAELYRKLEGSWNKKEKRKAIFISWAKYSDKWVDEIAEEKFDRQMRIRYEVQKGEEIKYCEMERTMNKYGSIRTIVIQSGCDKKRSAIFTNGKSEEISNEMIIQLMCRRWGEENLIKDILTNYFIDYSPGYDTEEMLEQPEVDNPKRKELIKQKGQLLHELHKLKVRLADEILNEEKVGEINSRKNQVQLKGDIAIIDNQVSQFKDEIKKTDEKVRFDKAHDGEKMVKLNYEKKRLLDCIKIFNYNLEKKMQEMLLKHYGNKKEVRAILKMIVERAGVVKLENGVLRVRLRKFRNTEVNYAARHLCEDLNKMNAATTDKFRFPLLYEVLEGAERV